ncbi:MAG: DUF3293 domain-containing protein [Saprospiraceae bacterium]|nr:DUF3293 domain-containing protein [Saprospiraceae bacterium]
MDYNALHQTYIDTTYWLYTHEQSFGICIGMRFPDFEAWLQRAGIQAWAMVTAANPRSQELSVEENEQRNVELREFLQVQGFSNLYAAEGKPDQGEWQPRAGFFIPNISLAQALTVAALFEQNAIVFGSLDEATKVVWVNNLE